MVSDKFILPPRPVGVIESLTSGFETVAGRLPLLLIPLILDLVLWVGPRFTLRPALVSLYEADQQATPSFEAMGKDMVDANKSYRDWLLQTTETVPNVYFPVFLLPTVLSGRDAVALPFGYAPTVLSTLSDMTGAVAVTILGGLVMWAMYMALIAGQVRYGAFTPRPMLRQLPGIIAQVALSLIALAVLMFVLIFFLSMFMGLLNVAGVDAAIGDNFLAGILLVLIFLIVIPATIFLGFTIHDMFLNDRNVIAAMWDSMRVVQWNLSATFGMLIVVSLIYTAMGYVWNQADPGSWLTLAAIGGHAFITTGLITATFVFYKDRYRYWREVREALLAELERRRAQLPGHQENNNR